jgi:hypothetical protein
MPIAPSCPFCDGDEVEIVSQFGSQILTSQWACRACNSYFEAIREEFGEPDADPDAQRSRSSK